MLAHMTLQHQSTALVKAQQNLRLPQMHKQYLTIAVGMALTCFTVQVQAADTAQTYTELPIPESAFEYEDYELPEDMDAPSATANSISNSNDAEKNRKVVSKEFIGQQAKLFFECTQVQTSAARLACFDKVAEQGRTPSYTAPKQSVDLAKTFRATIGGNPQVVFVEEDSTVVAAASADNSADNNTAALATEPSIAAKSSDIAELNPKETQILADIGVTQTDIEKYTPLSLSYDLDKNSERGTWTVRPYRPTYILPLLYTFNPNLNPSTPSRPVEPFTSNDVRQTELKFQLSLKTKVAEDLFDTSADLWFGYTQESHWQVYNEDDSRPFRATDYQPEIFLTQPVAADLPFGGRLRMLGVGAIHHSNGQSDPLSRSWNRAYLMAGAEWGKLSVVPRLWARVNGDSGIDDDNPDIEDYMGYGDVKFLYDLPNQKSLSGTLRYNPSTNKGAAQIDYVYPLTESAKGYVQLFQGYGKSIIDYNYENTSIGFGIVLNDWKGF